MTIRRATIRTEFEHARIIADALRPDNTAEMETVVDTESTSGNGDGDGNDATTIETVIERETTGGLRTTADDYVTNLIVAAQLTNNTDTNYE